jgi:hypothetical protein
MEDKGWGLGQAAWQLCQLDCNTHGALTLRRPGGIPVTRASLRGCTTADVQNPRKDHPGAFRLTLSAPDSAGALRYVLAGCATRGLSSESWRELLLAQRGNGVASLGVSSVLGPPAMFEVVQQFQPASSICSPNVQLVVGTMGIQIFDGPRFIASYLVRKTPP